jgi:Protein of unknown function (DUF1670)
MNPPSFAQKHYPSARHRFLQPSIQRFLQTQCPKVFGPLLAQHLAEKIVQLVEKQLPPKDHLRPGQVVWNAVSLACRPDSPNLKLVPVLLTLVDPSDIEQLETGTPTKTLAQKAIARICCEAHQQGALLSMRDIGLLCWRHSSAVSCLRQAWEQNHATTLPHSGSLQDFGSCISPKKIIVKKVLVDKKDPQRVAAETKHSQWAVDRYLKDFHRVETCYKQNKSVDFIAQVTALSPFLVKQYLEMINASNL